LRHVSHGIAVARNMMRTIGFVGVEYSSIARRAVENALTCAPSGFRTPDPLIKSQRVVPTATGAGYGEGMDLQGRQDTPEQELDAAYAAAVRDNPAYPYESEEESATARSRRTRRRPQADPSSSPPCAPSTTRPSCEISASHET
jgi:hypothetical protein